LTKQLNNVTIHLEIALFGCFEKPRILGDIYVGLQEIHRQYKEVYEKTDRTRIRHIHSGPGRKGIKARGRRYHRKRCDKRDNEKPEKSIA